MTNHEIFELWRNRSLADLTTEERLEYKADQQESNRRYDSAWQKVERRTPMREIQAFWEPFEGDLEHRLANAGELELCSIRSATIANADLMRTII